MAMEEKVDESLYRITSTKWPYQGQECPFVQRTDNRKEGDAFLCVLGGAARDETDFLSIDCDKNGNSIEFGSFSFNNKKDYSNASLKGLGNGEFCLSFLVYNEKLSHWCIIVINRFHGYNCFDCQTDEWIVRNFGKKEEIDPQTDHSRGIIISSSLVNSV